MVILGRRNEHRTPRRFAGCPTVTGHLNKVENNIGHPVYTVFDALGTSKGGDLLENLNLHGYSGT